MKYLLYEKKDNIGILKFNNPDSMNALSSAVFNEMKAFLSQLADSRDIRALILTGEGKAFIAGADIKEMRTMTPADAKVFSMLGNSVMNQVNAFPVPVIAAVNGYALGGGLEMALSADFIYASGKAKFGLPELTLGLIPGFGGSKRLSERVGAAAAKELLFTGRMIDAEEALRIGLANKVVEPEALMEEAVAVATEMMKVSPHAAEEVKMLINKCRDVDLDAALKIENNQFGLIFSHRQAQEGMAAFVEKRKPDWNK
jgi:enoyl-CoA hydratase